MYRFVRYATLVALVIWFGWSLFLKPTGLEPMAWQPAPDLGFDQVSYGEIELSDIQIMPLINGAGAAEHGPEDLALHPDGSVWVTSAEGGLYRIDGEQATWIGQLAGRPLGIEFASDGALWIADPYLGLARWTPDGGEEIIIDQAVLAGEVDGTPLRWANQLAIALDGRVFFSVSSSRFDPSDGSGTLTSSVTDIWEHHTTGYVAVYDPNTGQSERIAHGFNFTNGVALSPDEDFLLIAETGKYRVLRHWLTGPDAGTREVLVDNLPAFPDNLHLVTGSDGDGRYLLGLVSARSPIADAVAPYPTVRNVIWRLPELVRPAPALPTTLLEIDLTQSGVEVQYLVPDAAGQYPLITGGQVVGDWLYINSLGAPGLGRSPLSP